MPALNADCGDTGPCDGVAQETGDCADCHAPGIDGELGGRDLLDATDIAYDYGVHCDVCHKVESVDTSSSAPGVAGRLQILRPSEDSPSPALGKWAPLTFGPYADVVNPRMGSVQRDVYTSADLCSGCHQYDQPVRVVGASVDTARWPDGRLPVHSTYAEWGESSLGAGALVSCQSCHMPPDADVGNSSDLGNLIEVEADAGGGWYREPGAVRRHVWFGPRSSEQRMIDLVATLSVDTGVDDSGELRVDVTTQNVGAGHAIPTGEPMRALILQVSATCDGVAMAATGGDVLPDWAGSRDTQDAAGDWLRWPDAQVGDRVRVVVRTGEWHDYDGPGPFAQSGFSVEERGLAVEHYVGEATVLSVDGGGGVTLDAALPDGDIAYLIRSDAPLPSDGDVSQDAAGAPGVGFARVMVGADGARFVHHSVAVDVASDNRLLPTRAWTSTHVFEAGCDAPVVKATLSHRPYPLSLAEQRGWTLTDAVMASTQVTP